MSTTVNVNALVRWFVGSLVGSFVGWLVGWLVRWLAVFFFGWWWLVVCVGCWLLLWLLLCFLCVLLCVVVLWLLCVVVDDAGWNRARRLATPHWVCQWNTNCTCDRTPGSQTPRALDVQVDGVRKTPLRRPKNPTQNRLNIVAKLGR